MMPMDATLASWTTHRRCKGEVCVDRDRRTALPRTIGKDEKFNISLPRSYLSTLVSVASAKVREWRGPRSLPRFGGARYFAMLRQALDCEEVLALNICNWVGVIAGYEPAGRI
jgi:hypothetical protein